MVATAKAYSLTQTQQYSIEEYLAIEEKTGERHYYLNGKIEKMAGGTINHNRLCRNILSLLVSNLESNFESFGSDQKIYLPKLNFYVYPDAVVVTGVPIVAENDAQAIINPLLIVEVLSPSTMDYDRSQKFMHYKTVASFIEYVLIRQDAPEISTFFREEPNLWRSTETEGLDNNVFLKSVNLSLPLSKIYKNIF